MMMTFVDGYTLAVMVWYAGVEILHCEFCPDNISRWKKAKNFFILEFWPLLLPCIAVKTLIQVAKGADLKILPPGETGGEPKQIEELCEIAEDPDLPDTPYTATPGYRDIAEDPDLPDTDRSLG